MKVYLSGAMRGWHDLNRDVFRRYAWKLRDLGLEVFNPHESSLSQEDIRACMASDLDWICREADMIAIIPGWEGSLGVAAELATAKAIGIPVIYL